LEECVTRDAKLSLCQRYLVRVGVGVDNGEIVLAPLASMVSLPWILTTEFAGKAHEHHVAAWPALTVVLRVLVGSQDEEEIASRAGVQLQGADAAISQAATQPKNVSPDCAPTWVPVIVTAEGAPALESSSVTALVSAWPLIVKGLTMFLTVPPPAIHWHRH